MKHLEPKTDEVLEWTGTQYVLTKAFIKQNFDIAYKDDQVLDRRRMKNSRVVYSVITSRLNQANTQMALWLLNNTDCGRTFLRDILSEQMDADLSSGYNDLGMTSAINVANGSVIKREEIERNLLCVNAEMMLQGTTSYFPFNLFVQYEYPWNIRNYVYGIGYKR